MASLRSKALRIEYDAFIMYSVSERQWVTEILLPILEKKHGLKCCIQYRDFIPGMPFIDNVANSVYRSRKTVVGVSINFLGSPFCQHELTIVDRRLLELKDDSLIIIKLDDVDDNASSALEALSGQPYIDCSKSAERKTWETKLVNCLKAPVPGSSEKQTPWPKIKRFFSKSSNASVLASDAHAGDGDSDQNDNDVSSVPLEILSRGPLAVKTYNALKDGKTHIKRIPVMIIGQDRTGKTSLKKSLTGETFSATERSTEGIETDPSHFKVSTEIWSTGQRGKEIGFDSKFLFDHHAAKMMLRDLRKEKGDPNYSGESTLTKETDPPYAEESPVTTDERDSFRLSDEPTTSTSNIEVPVEDSKPTEQEVITKDSMLVSEVPEDLATKVASLFQDDQTVDDEEEIYSILWDFARQSVYYTTHPIFLTEKAIYLLAYNLSLNPHEKASVPVRQGVYKMSEEINDSKNNLDYLDFWMSSVYSLVRPDASYEGAAVSDITPTRLPPVFLVCTHADQPYHSKDPRQLALELYGFLRDKIYGNQLFKDVFVVDNTKSGGKQECPEVVRLREEVLAVAKTLPQVKESIPLKWLKYEHELQLLRQDGYKWIPFEKAREVASVKCGINDQEQLRTVLNFLHDQRLLIHFSETTELEATVILDPQWLIDVLKMVITVKCYEHTEESVEELWLKLEKTGILDERLLYHAWRPLFESQVTCQSLIAIMERFSLLCSWPPLDTTKQYLVPSMLMSPPKDDVLELLASVQIPSLFVRFESGRVPPGFFSRLVLLVYQYFKEEWHSPLTPELFHNFALFYILPDQGKSVIFLCHSSSIEVVVYSGNDAIETEGASLSHGNFDLSTSRAVHRQLRMILECMRKEFPWLKNMRYEMCVCCPVCSQKGSVKCCAHGVRGCECLHLLSEKDLQKCQYCNKPGVRGDCRIRTKMFAHWFSFSDGQEGRISLKQEQAATGIAIDERSIVSFKDGKDGTLALPAGVLDSIQSQSCDPQDVVVRLQESLQLNTTTLNNPDSKTKRWIRCLANAAKTERRMDVVKYLRTIAPAGTTGPLLREDLDVGCIPFKQRKELTFSLGGGDEWKRLAERLGMSYNEIRFIDKRTTNPCDVVLNLMAQHRYFSVGELYDKLVESELPGSADLL